MRKFVFPALFMAGVMSISAQTDKAALLESLEANQS